MPHRLVLAVVLLAAWLHSLFYVVTIPPWDLYDEEQHLAYALTIRDERRIPHLDDTIQPAIIASAVATDRWNAFRIGRPADTSHPAVMGLEGRSYEAYQPPLYYALAAVITIPAGDDALRAMYAARIAGSLLFIAFVWLTWRLAASWVPDTPPAWTGAALLVGSIPAGAQAGARVSNDLLAAVLVTATLVAIPRLLARPGVRAAAPVGILAALAALTKPHSLIVLPAIAVALAMLWRRQALSSSIAVAAILPVVLATGAWAVWTYTRYGVLDGSAAYLERYRTYAPLPAAKFLRAFWLNTWSDYWGAYGYDGALLVATNLLLIGILAVTVVGLVRRDTVSIPLVLTGVMLAATLAALAYANHTAIVRPGGRMLLVIWPPLSILIVAGWQQLGGTRSAVLPPTLLGIASVGYALVWFLPHVQS